MGLDDTKWVKKSHKQKFYLHVYELVFHDGGQLYRGVLCVAVGSALDKEGK